MTTVPVFNLVHGPMPSALALRLDRRCSLDPVIANRGHVSNDQLGERRFITLRKLHGNSSRKIAAAADPIHTNPMIVDPEPTRQLFHHVFQSRITIQDALRRSCFGRISIFHVKNDNAAIGRKAARPRIFFRSRAQNERATMVEHQASPPAHARIFICVLRHMYPYLQIRVVR